jgi:hypothetical protein
LSSSEDLARELSCCYKSVLACVCFFWVCLFRFSSPQAISFHSLKGTHFQAGSAAARRSVDFIVESWSVREFMWWLVVDLGLLELQYRVLCSSDPSLCYFFGSSFLSSRPMLS